MTGGKNVFRGKMYGVWKRSGVTGMTGGKNVWCLGTWDKKKKKKTVLIREGKCGVWGKKCHDWGRKV